ncbi:hypothetical protein GCM10020256_48750 [Streptomyces thermocoprophilus]
MVPGPGLDPNPADPVSKALLRRAAAGAAGDRVRVVRAGKQTSYWRAEQTEGGTDDGA